MLAILNCSILLLVSFELPRDSKMQEESNVSDSASKRSPMITWADERQGSLRNRLSRKLSSESLVIRSVSRTASVDPSLVLPTQFRTQ